MAGKQADGRDVGIQDDGVAGGDVIQLPKHVKRISDGGAQRFGHDGHVVLGMGPRYEVFDKDKIGGWGIAFPAAADDTAMMRQVAEKGIEEEEQHLCHLDDATLHRFLLLSAASSLEASSGLVYINELRSVRKRDIRVGHYSRYPMESQLSAGGI